MPSNYDGVDEIKKVIGNSYVQAYSLNDELEIIEGQGRIKSDNRWNYHCNYDDSEDCMFFKIEGRSEKEQYFTTSLEEIKKIQQENIKAYRKVLQDEIKRIDNL